MWALSCRASPRFRAAELWPSPKPAVRMRMRGLLSKVRDKVLNRIWDCVDAHLSSMLPQMEGRSGDDQHTGDTGVGREDMDEGLRLVDHEKEVIRLEEADEPVLATPLRPSQPTMRKLGEEDIKALEEKAKADPEMPWVDEVLELEGEKSVVPWKLYGGVALFFLCLAAWGGWLLLKKDDAGGSHLSAAADKEDALPKISAFERAELERKETEEAKDFYHNLEDVLSRYYLAEKPEDFIGIIRHEERVMPLIREYYQRNDFTPNQYHSISEFRSLSLENRPMIGMSVKFKGGGNNAILVEDSPDGVLVDWESERAYVPLDIDDYIKQRPTEPVELRVYVRKDHFYLYGFSDDKKYQSLKLLFRDADEYLNGYIERGSESALRIAKLLKRVPNGRMPLLLSVRFLEGDKGKRSVLIEKLVSEVWAYGEDPLKADKG